MNDLIGFMVSLGEGPAQAPGALHGAVARAGLDGAARDAVLRRDVAAVNALLGGRTGMWCAIMTPEESPEEGDEPRREAPARDDPEPDTEEA